MSLVDILYNILTRFYAQHESLRQSQDSQKLQDILDISSRIDHFEESLPDYLCVSSGLTTKNHDLDACLQMQANILKSRCVNVAEILYIFR